MKGKWVVGIQGTKGEASVLPYRLVTNPNNFEFQCTLFKCSYHAGATRWWSLLVGSL